MSKLSTVIICLALMSLVLCSGVSLASAYLSDDSAQYVVKSTLENAGLNDITTRIGDGRANGGEKSLILSYRSSATDTSDLISETGKILGAFVGTVKSGWDCDSLLTVVGTASGGTAGMWSCSKEWKDAYLAGQLDEASLVLKVAGTMKTF